MLLKVNNNIHTQKIMLKKAVNYDTKYCNISSVKNIWKRPVDLRNLITSLITS